MSQWSGPFSWWIPVSIAVFVTSIVAMTVSVLATGEAVSVAAHCSEEIKNIHKVHKVHISGFSSTPFAIPFSLLKVS